MDLEFWMNFISFLWSVIQMAEKILNKKRPEHSAKKKRKVKRRK